MPRELMQRLIARKAEINRELSDVKARNSRILEQHPWVTEEIPFGASLELTPEDLEIQGVFRKDEARMLALEEQFQRAQLFGLRHAKDSIPTLCLSCFVDRGESSRMIECTEGHWSGDRLFRCESDECRIELPVATIVDHP